MSEELSILQPRLTSRPGHSIGDGYTCHGLCFFLGRNFSADPGLSRAQKHARLFEDTFWSGAELVGLYKQVVNSPNLIGLEAVFKAGFQEFTRLRQDVKSDPDAVMEGVHRAMAARAKEEERLEAHLPFLASRFYQPIHRFVRYGHREYELIPWFGYSQTGHTGSCQVSLRPWLPQRSVCLLPFLL